MLLFSKLFSNKTFLGTFTILATGLALCEKAGAFTLTAETRLSQFDSFKSHQIILPDTSEGLLRQASSEVFTDNRDVRAVATASATRLEAGLINYGNGIHIPGAVASFDDVLFKIIYNEALVQYASTEPFGVLLNFDVAYELDTPKDPDRSRQSTANLSASLAGRQVGFRGSTTGGRATVVNGTNFYRNTTGGFLEDLSASGGSKNVGLYVPLYLQGTDDIFIETNGSVGIGGLALKGGAAFSKGGVVLSYNPNDFILSSDGRPLSEFGISYMPLAGDDAPDDTPSIPTPALLPGLLAMGAAAIRKHKQEAELEA